MTRRGHFAFYCLLALLSACSARPPAPVVDRSTQPRAEIPVDGLHQVHRGDTLHGIAFKYGLDYRDIASWNGIRSPYTIYPDQVIRVRPGPAQATQGSGRQSTASVATKPAPAPKSSTRTSSSGTNKSSSGASKPATPVTKPAAKSVTASAGTWAWPAEGRVLRTFKDGDPTRNGLDIAGKEGRAVVAAGAGEVVYSGNGLIGYGELVIIKHNDRMLSAYAHNKKRLVAEGATVSQGEKIAEIGRNDRNEQVLHFEIRKDGKPVNPLNYLPSR